MEKTNYLAVFEKSKGGYGAYCPDLPGLVVVGDTLEDTEKLLREGIEILLEEYREEGWEIPDPNTTHSKLIEVKSL